MWNSLFGDGPKAIVPEDPYRKNTPLCTELELAMEFANGDLEAWDAKPWSTRRMWVYFRILQNEKKRRHEERMIQERQNEMERMKNMPKVYRDRPGVRS